MAKYLIIAPADINDMLAAQGLFISLQQVDQEAVIDVLAPAATFPLLSRMPQVGEGILMPSQINWKEGKRLCQALRNKGYDQAIVMNQSRQATLLLWFARIKKHNDWRSILPPPLATPALQVSIEAKLQASAQFHLDLEKPLLALCPGAEPWSAACYAEVAQHKVGQGWQVALFGSAADRQLADEINQLAGNVCHNVVGQTGLQELVDCLACADTVVTQDSVYKHIVNALHKNVIVVPGAHATISAAEVLQQIEA